MMSSANNGCFIERIRFPLHVSTAPVGLGVPTVEVPTSHSDTPHSVGYEWSARRRDLYLTTHNTHTRNRQPCTQRDWNPQSQKGSARRPNP